MSGSVRRETAKRIYAVIGVGEAIPNDCYQHGVIPGTESAVLGRIRSTIRTRVPDRLAERRSSALGYD